MVMLHQFTSATLWSRTMAAHSVRWLGMLLLTTAVLQGCKCGDGTNLNSQPWRCEAKGRPGTDANPCTGSQRYVDGACVDERCNATGEDNCCPGTYCSSSGLCKVPAARIQNCTENSQCSGGQVCLERPRINADSKTCGFATVGTDGTCPDGLTAFNGRCVQDAPCGGRCGDGSVCNIDLNACEQPTFIGMAQSGCSQTCGDGQLLVYTNPDLMLFDQCCDISCACVALPAVPAGVWGRYADLQPTDAGVLVSSYNSTYGDLVLSTHQAANGQLSSLEFLDGVPTTGRLVGDPNGPRHGYREIGPNVGEHTALAVYQNKPRIAYFDVDRNRLKFAAFDASNSTWAISVIDDGSPNGPPDQEPAVPATAMVANARVGMYPAIMIDSAGFPHVTYFAERSMRGGRLITTPMYARAKTVVPKKPSDWEITAVEATPTCNGTCTASQVCVLEGNTPRCAQPSSSATACGACGCGNTCVIASDNGAACRAVLPSHLGEPCGGSCATGQTCASDTAGGSACYTKMDNSCTPACGAKQVCISPTTQGGTPECRAATPYSATQSLAKGVGLFTSLAMVGDHPWAVYYDSVHGHVRGAVANFSSRANIATGFTTQAIQCESKQDFGQHAAIAVAPTGNRVAVVYQGDNGKTLWVYQGSNFIDGAAQLVDDGVRENRLHVVGAYASPAYGPDGTLYIAYADQTTNDLLVAYQANGQWVRKVVLSAGAFGSFADLAIAQNTMYVSTFQWDQRSGRDTSRLNVHVVSLAELQASTADPVPVH